MPRLFSFITAFIWFSFSVFFKRNVNKTIDQLCPQGNLSSLGGKEKRNIQTLGICVVVVIHYNILSSSLDGDLCMVSLFILFLILDNITVILLQTYQDQLGLAKLLKHIH